MEKLTRIAVYSMIRESPDKIFITVKYSVVVAVKYSGSGFCERVLESGGWGRTSWRQYINNPLLQEDAPWDIRWSIPVLYPGSNIEFELEYGEQL